MVNRVALYHLRECIVIIFKHKTKILLSLAAAIAALCIVLSLLPSGYLAKATVMVKFGREFVPVSEIGDSKTPVLNQDSIINTEAEIITGRDLGSRVVDQIGAAAMYPEIKKRNLTAAAERQAAIELFRADISASGIKGTNLISVSFKHRNRETAAKAFNLLLDRFKERHLEIFSDPKSSFMEQQAKVYGERLREAQNTLTGYKQTQGLFAVEDQRSVVVKQLDRLDEAISREQMRLREIENDSAVFASPAGQVGDAVMSQLQLQLSSLEQKEQQLVDKYSDTSQFVLAVQKEMRFVKQQIEARTKENRSLEATRMRAQIEPIKEKIADLNRSRKELQRQLQTIDQKTVGLQSLKREVTLNEDRYATYMRKLEESNISSELDRKKMTNITIVENAVASSVPNPIKQPKKIVILLTLCAAIALGTGFICEFLPQKVTTPERLERLLGLPVLAAIPQGKI